MTSQLGEWPDRERKKHNFPEIYYISDESVSKQSPLLSSKNVVSVD
jgi:hypothetical protein